MRKINRRTAGSTTNQDAMPGFMDDGAGKAADHAVDPLIAAIREWGRRLVYHVIRGSDGHVVMARKLQRTARRRRSA
ncbi:MAG: hypothetical protein M1140_07485 [Chloroflexi bacterium]|nr:hypothetical protein [Chloroflexota bacterium]